MTSTIDPNNFNWGYSPPADAKKSLQESTVGSLSDNANALYSPITSADSVSQDQLAKQKATLGKLNN
ncbi:MAG: hypothetical protein JKY93_13035 [Gammaproteobacteria bacterium]|nr:hypothetical protein [Gammaproteobacteria bacterium]